MRGRIIRAEEPHRCDIGDSTRLPLGSLVECAECGTWWRVGWGEWGRGLVRPKRKDRKKIAALEQREEQS